MSVLTSASVRSLLLGSALWIGFPIVSPTTSFEAYAADGQNGDGQNGDGQNGDGQNGDGQNGDGQNGDGQK